jgi:hypothetical protein
MKSKASSEAIPRRYMWWIIGLTITALSVTVSTVVSIIVGLNEVRYLVLPLTLRGTVIAAWFVGALLVVASGLAIRARARNTLELLVNIVFALSALSMVMTLVAGIDLTRVFTSPATLMESLGDAFAKIISNMKLTPEGMRGVGGETVIGAITRVGTSLAVMQLIGFLPFPYNVIVFFMYYKFFTAMLFCLLPFAAGTAALFVAYSARVELQRNGDVKRLLSADESSSEDEPLINTHIRGQVDRRLGRSASRAAAVSRTASRETLYQAV